MSSAAGNDDGCIVIEGIGTANPSLSVEQCQVAEFMLRIEGLSEPLRHRIPKIYERSGIKKRFSCLQDYAKTWEQFDFYPRSPDLLPQPTTLARNRIYQAESVPLAASASAECLNESGVGPEEITHLIVVSCTGFFAPGIDIHLVKRLGLRADTARTVIGFMGCYAAFNGLKTAAALCRADHEARVLLVCVELCTLHFQIDDALESVVVNALFSDGAAAALIRHRSEESSSSKLIYRDAHSVLADDTLDSMSWSVGDTGFLMGLSPKVPEQISESLPGFIHTLTQRSGLTASDIDFWAVHPGGRQVLDRTASILNLSASDIEDSYGVLSDYGNMSSPTVLFILRRIMKSKEQNDGRRGIALAFGPGLTIEGCLLEFGS